MEGANAMMEDTTLHMAGCSPYWDCRPAHGKQGFQSNLYFPDAGNHESVQVYTFLHAGNHESVQVYAFSLW